MELVLLLVFLPFTYSVKHSLTYFLTTSSGLQNFPEFLAVAVVDDIQLGSCNSINRTAEPKQNWTRKFIEDDPGHLEWYTQSCRRNHDASVALIQELKLLLNQSGGVHILQEMAGCELDDETKKFLLYNQFGFNGEDFMSFDQRMVAWVYTEKAAAFKNKWGREYGEPAFIKSFMCPQLLKRYLEYGNSYLQRKAPPSVSLLQKTPSSPVSCHATGFYPDRVDMFWRKDGEEIHEDVGHGEILPNHDGTFQMRVDLNISSVKPEEWSRYDCVFQISGVKKDVITKLDKAEIRTGIGINKVPPSEFPAAVIGVVVGLLLLLVCITGLFIWRKKKNNGFQPANTSDLTDRNPGPAHGE
uniref:Ig-like domain-containing protein n=1 Tax=Anabas testudineus TaxID=64144 RepID=A0A3Q1IYP4_ANATE